MGVRLEQSERKLMISLDAAHLGPPERYGVISRLTVAGGVRLAGGWYGSQLTQCWRWYGRRRVVRLAVDSILAAVRPQEGSLTQIGTVVGSVDTRSQEGYGRRRVVRLTVDSMLAVVRSQEGSLTHIGTVLSQNKDFSVSATENEFADELGLNSASPALWAERYWALSVGKTRDCRGKLGVLCQLGSASRPDTCARSIRLAAEDNSFEVGDVHRTNGLIVATKSRRPSDTDWVSLPAASRLRSGRVMLMVIRRKKADVARGIPLYTGRAMCSIGPPVSVAERSKAARFVRCMPLVRWRSVQIYCAGFTRPFRTRPRGRGG